LKEKGGKGEIFPNPKQKEKEKKKKRGKQINKIEENGLGECYMPRKGKKP